MSKGSKGVLVRITKFKAGGQFDSDEESFGNITGAERRVRELKPPPLEWYEWEIEVDGYTYDSGTVTS